MNAEAFAGQAEQLLGNGEVDERRVNVAVPEVGREEGQSALRVDPFAIPLEHAVNDEGVAQVVDTRSAPADIRLEAGCVDDAAQELLDGDVSVPAPLVHEQSAVWGRKQSGALACGEIASERRHHRSPNRQPTRLEELSLTNLQHTLVEPEVSELEPRDLAYPQPDAVAKDEHGVERRGTKRSVGRRELAGRAKQAPDLINRIDVRAAALAEHGLLQHPIEPRRILDTGVEPLQGPHHRPSDPDVLVLDCRRARLGRIGLNQSRERLGICPSLCKTIEPKEGLLVALVSERAHALDVIAQCRTDMAAVARQWSQPCELRFRIFIEQGRHDRANAARPAGPPEISKRVHGQMTRGYEPIEEGIDDLGSANDQGPWRDSISRLQPRRDHRLRECRRCQSRHHELLKASQDRRARPTRTWPSIIELIDVALQQRERGIWPVDHDSTSAGNSNPTSRKSSVASFR